MNDQTYQPPSQQPQYQAPAQPYQQPAKVNIYDHFVAPGKLGLFLLLSAGMLVLGVLILDMCFSGMLDGDIRALIFLGEFVVDFGIIAILTLLMIGGVTRTDLAEKTQSHMLRAAGFGFGLYIVAWSIRMMSGGFSLY